MPENAKDFSTNSYGFSANEYDAVIIGSGPNGLAAAAVLTDAGARVLVLEMADEFGGGTRTAELTLPGFHHDVCSAAHPMGILSPYLKTLPLERYGLRWIQPPVSVAHPLADEPAVLMHLSIEETAANLDPEDARAYEKLYRSFVRHGEDLLSDALGPLNRFPARPLQMMRFGLLGLRSAAGLAKSRFRGQRARALFAGCAAHSILPLSSPLSAALGLVFTVTGHLARWPVAAGGSRNITKALSAYISDRGGELRAGVRVRSLEDLPPAKAVLFDTSPAELLNIAKDALPAGYVKKLRRYRYGPGVFKLDWALDGPIPWKDERCLQASTVHVGGTLDEIAAAEFEVGAGRHAERPYVLAVQQSQFDDSRAPAGKHTGYAYIHVPGGSTLDQSDVLESQIERFAPGFRDRILARRAMHAMDFEAYNPNYIGGAITGGVADLPQAFLRPVARFDPYSTPNKHLYICSAATPPGGGVHGMCGYFAAQSVLKRLRKLSIKRF